MDDRVYIAWFRPDTKTGGVFNKSHSRQRAEEIASGLNAKYSEYHHYLIDAQGEPVVMPQMMPEVQELSEN